MGPADFYTTALVLATAKLRIAVTFLASMMNFVNNPYSIWIVFRPFAVTSGRGRS